MEEEPPPVMHGQLVQGHHGIFVWCQWSDIAIKLPVMDRRPDARGLPHGLPKEIRRGLEISQSTLMTGILDRRSGSDGTAFLHCELYDLEEY